MTIARTVYLASAAALATLAVPASAATITFSGLDTSGSFGGNGRAFTTYSEAGFTVSAPAGQYVQSTNGANSAANALLTGQFNTTINALLTITGPSLFTFTSFDARAQTLDATYTVTGYLGASQLYATSGIILAPTSGSAYNTYGGFSSATVDRVTIATNAPFQLYLDNVTTGIAATAGAVPEPATWAMMIAGFGLVGGTMRRRSTKVAYAA